MDLKSIEEMWAKDSKLDETLLDEESLNIPQLHSKYLTILNTYKQLMASTQMELKKLRHKKWLYYSGKEIPEGEDPLPYRVIKSDVQHWIGIDDQVLKVEAKLEIQTITTECLMDILRQINNRNFLVKNAIEWRRFTSGI